VRPARTDKTNITTYARPLIASALIAGGFINLAAPVFAQTVPAANSDISNTATASYQDPNDTTNPDGSAKVITTVSNTVTLKVAKVAGILVEKDTLTDLTAAGAFNSGDTIQASFNVTNTGNDKVRFKVPKLATLTNGNSQVVEYESTTPGTWVTVTDATSTSQSIDVNGVLKVRVTFKINDLLAKGTAFDVKLGHTKDAKANNIKRGVGIGEDSDDLYDIYTVNAPDALVPGDAANGTREASDTQGTVVGAIGQTFTKIALTHDPVTANVADPSKDDVTYRIVTSVPTSDPAYPNSVGTDLAPTAIKVDTFDIKRVFVGYPLPTGNVLTAAPTAPTGWTPIYKIGGVWTANTPVGATALGTVTEVGFLYTPTGVTDTTSLTASSTAVYNFSVNVTAAPGSTTSTATFYGKNTKADGTVTTEIALLSTDAFDTTRTVASEIYNGPDNKPEATAGGTDGNNKDFSNKSMNIAASEAKRTDKENLDKINITSLVNFKNTVENKTNAAIDVYLLPEKITGFIPPVGTTVTIKNTNGSDVRTYTYTANGYTASGAGTPLKLAVGAYTGVGTGLVGYSVDVTLPSGKSLDQLVGYPVAITAFTTNATISSYADGALVSVPAADPVAIPAIVVTKNTTIDRVYTGFIDLQKEVRVIPDITQDYSTVTYYKGSIPATVKATPGEFIQYRIKAVNVSDNGVGGTGNQLLKASNLSIIEDGSLTGSKWAATTVHVQTKAKVEVLDSLNNASAGGTIKFDGAGVDPATNVTVYTVNFSDKQIAPTEAGSFTFIRKINLPVSSNNN
jgi:hypothetical protein